MATFLGMPQRASISISPNSAQRLRALAILHYGHQHRLHARLPVSPRTLAVQLQKGQLSNRLAAALQAEIGEAGWRFVTGEAENLPAERGCHGPR